MLRCALLALLLVSGSLAATARAAEPSAPFELVDGDRVVLIGNTLIERAQRYGYWETALTAHYPQRNITFRNLGWSGDTVFGEARARFGNAAEGFAHLEKHLRQAKPTVILVGYGSNAAHAGEAGLPEFLRGLDRLLGVLESTDARIVLLAPRNSENLGPPLPDPRAYNDKLRLYRQALREVAQRRGYPFVDLQEQLPASESVPNGLEQLTDNSLHFTAYGYWRSAEALQQGLGLISEPWQVRIDARGTAHEALGTELFDVKTSPNGVTFAALDQRLPNPLPPQDAPAGAASLRDLPTLRVEGLAPGRYQLAVDNQPVAIADAAAWAEGVCIESGPQLAQVENLREQINRKNKLVFHRYRPQNETYLYLFRKHEQGQNAAEIPQFDPLIAALEQEIATLRVPVAHRFELRPAP